MRHFLLGAVLFLTLAGIASAQTQQLILPVALNGYVLPPVHYQTTLRIVNLTANPVDVTAEAFENDGTAIRIFELFPVAKSGTTTVFSIGGLGSVEAFTAEDVPDLNGWILLTFDANAQIYATAEASLINAPVGPHPICTRPSTEILTTVQVASVPAAKKFSGVAVIHVNRIGGYAIVNPSPTQSVTTFLSLLDSTGHMVGSATMDIPPQGRISHMLTEFFPSSTSDLMGSLRVTATSPVAVGAVSVLFPEGKFVSSPVQPIAASICSQLVVPAMNPLTNECRQFPTPCDVPEGWQPVQSCSR